MPQYRRLFVPVLFSSLLVACGGNDIDQSAVETSGGGGGDSFAPSSSTGSASTAGGADGSGGSGPATGTSTSGTGGQAPIKPWDGSKVDVIGYYGNSGNAVDAIPRLSDVPCYYNIVIITFANFADDGSLEFELQGPYENDLAALKADIKTWKAGSDPYGRERKVLLSIGGQNGHWPEGLTASQVSVALDGFLADYDLDGLDVDLEGASVSNASTLVEVVIALRKKGMLVTAAPEAAQSPLSAYASLLPHLDWVQPQFYNNPPNAVTTPFVPAFGGNSWVAPPNDWQGVTPDGYEGAGQSYWLSVLEATSKHLGLSDSQKGMLIPTSKSAASSYNDWDIAQLKQQIQQSKVRHVGTWAIAYDNEIGYQFAKAMASIMDPSVTCGD